MNEHGKYMQESDQCLIEESKKEENKKPFKHLVYEIQTDAILAAIEGDDFEPDGD
jgi:hypothetical protein